MIRKFKGTDLDAVADIWLATNLETHDFIPASYWRSHFEMVKSQLSQAELYVCEQKGEIQGFVGLCGEYIAGIFVSGEGNRQTLAGLRKGQKRAPVFNRIPEERPGNAVLSKRGLCDSKGASRREHRRTGV